MHRIDPRIVIIQIALSGICAFWIFKPLAMLCEVIFLMSFLLYLQHPKEALRLGVWFAFLVGLYALLNESNAPQIIVQPVFLLRKLSPLLGVMVLSLKALTVSNHRLHRGVNFGGILWCKNGHTRNHPHDGKIIQTLMGRTQV